MGGIWPDPDFLFKKADPEIATVVVLFDQFNADGAFDEVKVRTAVGFCNPDSPNPRAIRPMTLIV